jgi:hypothetical protein
MTISISRSTEGRTVGDREKTAERLLKATEDRWYDPEIDIDWSAPLEPDKHFMPEHRLSLYGTRMWDALTPQQRIELGRHQAASIAGAGIFFEVILMRLLTKLVYDTDPTSRHAQYAMAEVADECRHSTMFGRMIERIGGRAGLPLRRYRMFGTLMVHIIGGGPAMFGAVLVVEEVLDRLQREQMADQTVQPLLRMVSRIHVLEEARHVTFAREEIVRQVGRLRRTPLGRLRLVWERLLLGCVAVVVTRSLITPRVYGAVGLDPAQAGRVALANPHHRESLRFAGERITAFLDELGLIAAPGRRLWRRSFLLR